MSCVRSSLIFGLHATGLTDAVLRKLSATDSRHLRAIARSPAHITHESTAELRRRLAGCESIRACTDPASVADMEQQLKWLTHLTEPTVPGQAGSNCRLVPCSVSIGVACPTCGQYFDNMRHMLSHHTKQHGPRPERAPIPRSTQYTAHTVDGLPQRRHCLSRFTRVEALQKHLRGACPVLHGGLPPTTLAAGTATTASEVLGASNQAGSLGHSRRVPPVAPSHAPLIDCPDFLRSLRQNWRLTAAGIPFVNVLRQHCVFCHQWVSLRGPGVKQHLRLAHPGFWAHKVEAQSLRAEAGLDCTSPCAYCGLHYKDQRSHLKHCPVLFSNSRL